MSKRVELPELYKAQIIHGLELYFSGTEAYEFAQEIARRCNNWLEVADNVACLLSAIEHFVPKDESYDLDMEPHIKELERLIGGDA